MLHLFCGALYYQSKCKKTCCSIWDKQEIALNLAKLSLKFCQTFPQFKHWLKKCLFEQTLAFCFISFTFVHAKCMKCMLTIVKDFNKICRQKLKRFSNSTFWSRPNFVPFNLVHEWNLSPRTNTTVNYDTVVEDPGPLPYPHPAPGLIFRPAHIIESNWQIVRRKKWAKIIWK